MQSTKNAGFTHGRSLKRCTSRILMNLRQIYSLWTEENIDWIRIRSVLTLWESLKRKFSRCLRLRFKEVFHAQNISHRSQRKLCSLNKPHLKENYKKTALHKACLLLLSIILVTCNRTTRFPTSSKTVSLGPQTRTEERLHIAHDHLIFPNKNGRHRLKNNYKTALSSI